MKLWKITCEIVTESESGCYEDVVYVMTDENDLAPDIKAPRLLPERCVHVDKIEVISRNIPRYICNKKDVEEAYN